LHVQLMVQPFPSVQGAPAKSHSSPCSRTPLPQTGQRQRLEHGAPSGQPGPAGSHSSPSAGSSTPFPQALGGHVQSNRHARNPGHTVPSHCSPGSTTPFPHDSEIVVEVVLPMVVLVALPGSEVVELDDGHGAGVDVFDRNVPTWFLSGAL